MSIRRLGWGLVVCAGCFARADESATSQEGEIGEAVFAVDVAHFQGPISQYETDCLWDKGVRHLVAGTQIGTVTRQQLTMARSRGMTIDAYVYLYWGRDPVQQIKDAFAVIDGFHVGRLWLDVEDEQRAAELGATGIGDRLARSLDECRTHPGITCGIYTGPGFWRTYMNDTTRFADVPLWYAAYNGTTQLSAWAEDKFGGWAAPVAKQWTDQALCGFGVDQDTMKVLGRPEVTVDRTPPPAPTAAPAAPHDLWPLDGAVADPRWVNVTPTPVRLMVATEPGATGYEFSMEMWDVNRWRTYASFRPSVPFFGLTPSNQNRLYRFRVRARNTLGWGAWSAWSLFEYGPYTGPRPGPGADLPEGDTPMPIAPDGTSTSAANIDLVSRIVTGATEYTFGVEYLRAGTWTPYASLTSPTSIRTFSPVARPASYRFRVQARTGGVWSEWSPYASFAVTR